MRLKSYFVHSVEEAIQQAKNELGAEAMLVDTKSLAAQPGNRSRVEVIFAAPTQSPAPPPVVAAPAAAPDSPALHRFRGGLTSLLNALTAPPGSGHLGAESQNPAMEELCARMAAADVPTDVARRFGEDLAGSLETNTAAFLAAQIPQAAISLVEPRRIALIGPTGSGKTTVAAKLAYRLGLEKGIAPLVLSLDNIKIGASDQLSRLCRLLGVAFQPIENAGDLRAVLEENTHRRLILIDTPGLHPGDPDLAADLAACMAGPDVLERHLVVPASARFATMETWFGQAAPLAIDHLLFTRLDETALLGPMWSLAATQRLPMSWLSLGPRIPEDLEPANAPRLCDAIAGCAAPTAPLRANAAGAGSRHS